MRLLADLHTHSKNSRFWHGKNTIEEMAIKANEIGLVEIAITDHSYAHLFRTNKHKLIEARKKVDEINSWSKTKVLLGLEANILSEDGTLDVDNETLALLDVLVVGYHRMIRTDFAGYFGGCPKTEEAKRKCTNAFVNAVKRYPVTLISHINSILDVDLYEVGKACAEQGTMIEINNRHPKFTQKQIDDLLASECLLCVSSDAHSRETVGEVDEALAVIKKFDIPSENVANVEFLPDEQSEADRKYRAYHSVFEQTQQEKQKRQEKIEEKKSTEFVGSLSKEMEDELNKIAIEKGFSGAPNAEAAKLENFDNYVGDYAYLKDKQDIDEVKALVDNYNSSVNVQREFDQIDIYNDNTETAENSGLNVNNQNVVNPVAVNQAVYNQGNSGQPSSEVSHSQQHAMSDFERKSDILKNLVDNEPEVPVNQTEEVKVTPEQVSTQKFEEVNPENFMDSITRTNLVNQAELAKGNAAQTRSTEPTVQKPAPKPKPSVKRGSFISVDDLIDKN